MLVRLGLLVYGWYEVVEVMKAIYVFLGIFMDNCTTMCVYMVETVYLC